MDNQMFDVKYQFHQCKTNNKKFDIDLHCRKIYEYHQRLWQKKLPNGANLKFQIKHKGGSFFLLDNKSGISFGSDSILHTYRHFKKGYIREVIEKFNVKETNKFYEEITSIGGYIIFPKRINSLNQRRGTDALVKDRFDITLDSIRKYYQKDKLDYPLKKVIEKDGEFFSWFMDFKSYVSFFYLDDLVNPKTDEILFFSEDKPLPRSKEGYLAYKDKVLFFLKNRNKRIKEAMIKGIR